MRSTEAAGALQAVTDATSDLVQLDSQVRENLRFGEELIAADLIFSDGRSAIDTAAKELRGIRDAERAAFSAERAALVRQTWTTLGAGALLWLVGLVLLVRAPATRRDSLALGAQDGAPVQPPAPSHDSAGTA